MAGWKVGLMAGLALVIAIPIVASRLLPWWGTLLVLLVEVGLIVVLGPQLIRWGVTQVAMGVLVRKSRVLQGAGVEIHEVKAVDRPEDAAPQGEPLEEHLRYVQAECTITPRPGASEMQFYEPGELLLVAYDAPVSEEEHPEEGEAGTVAEVWVVDDAGGVQRDPGKVSGEARLRIVFACPARLSGRVKFRYYFEQFGDLVIG